MQGCLDVPALGSFVPPGQQNDNGVALLLEVHPVARSVVDPQLRNAFADGPDVSRVPGGQTLDPDQNAGPGARVPQAVQPLGVDLRLADLEHARNVVSRLHAVKSFPAFRDAGEAFELHDGQWLLIASAKDDDPVGIRPFDAITFSLGDLRP